MKHPHNPNSISDTHTPRSQRFVCFTCVSRVWQSSKHHEINESSKIHEPNILFSSVQKVSVSCVCEASECHELNDSSKILELKFHLSITISTYGLARVSRIDKIIGLFCRISFLLWGSFAKETYNLIDPTDRSHRIVSYSMRWLRLVGALKFQVSFAKETYKRDDILQERHLNFEEPTNSSHLITPICVLSRRRSKL